MPEGRAIEGIKALKAAGKAPQRLVFEMAEGAIGQLTKPYPANAPTIKSVWEKETGITIEIVGVAPENAITKVMQDISTKASSYDIYQTAWNDIGTLVEAGGLVNLDEFVAKYKPEWDDPKRGYVGGVQGVTLLNKYSGSYYAVSLDGDFQTWIYRKDLFEDPKERADFKAVHGWELRFPETWDELDQVATFFHRPDKGLFGCTDLRNQGWGYTNWYQRYCSMGAPNRMLFDLHAKAGTLPSLINSPEGINATKGYVASLKYHSPDAISWGWPEQYGNMGGGGAAITCAFSNMPKFLDSAANAGSKVTGKLAAALPSGAACCGSTWCPRCLPSRSTRKQVTCSCNGWAAVEPSRGCRRTPLAISIRSSSPISTIRWCRNRITPTKWRTFARPSSARFPRSIIPVPRPTTRR
jgi:multiple sugar transport system substrate-binding protein